MGFAAHLSGSKAIERVAKYHKFCGYIRVKYISTYKIYPRVKDISMLNVYPRGKIYLRDKK